MYSKQYADQNFIVIKNKSNIFNNFINKKLLIYIEYWIVCKVQKTLLFRFDEKDGNNNKTNINQYILSKTFVDKKYEYIFLINHLNFMKNKIYIPSESWKLNLLYHKDSNYSENIIYQVFTLFEIKRIISSFLEFNYHVYY